MAQVASANPPASETPEMMSAASGPLMALYALNYEGNGKYRESLRPLSKEGLFASRIHVVSRLWRNIAW